MFKLTKVRKEIQFSKEIGGIINVLKGVASSEFYRLQKERKQLEEFGDYLKDFFQTVDISGFHHPLLETSSLPPTALLITSDAGFLGKLNISVVNIALERYTGKGKLIIVGRQGARLAGEVGRSFHPFPGISDDVDYKQVEKLGNFIFDSFLDKKIGSVVVIYPHFISFSVQKVQVYQLLPCRFLFREETKVSESQDIPPSPGLRRTGKVSKLEEETIVEPSLSKIIEYLVRVWMNYMLYGIFWESKLSEWAARVMHLEGSSFEIRQLHKKLHFQYFRLLHEISDKNIREIFSTRLAMKRELNNAER